MRTINSLRNIFAGLFGEVFNLALAFVSRTVFIQFLSIEFLGITGLFTNILSVLNLAELGVGMAIVYALYEPLAKDDKEKIKSLMHIYRKAYFLIGLAVCFLGVAAIPFLPYFMKGSTNLVNANIVFCLYLLQTVTSYWFFAYKTALLQADQKSYISSAVIYAVSCCGKVVQIAFLFLLRDQAIASFYLYIAWGVVFNIVANFIIARIVDKRYPYLKETDIRPLSVEESGAMKKNIYGLTLYKISSTVNSAADNIIISSFIGLTLVGLYSSYTIIISSVAKVVNTIMGSLTASIGNLNVSETKERSESFFEVLHLSAFWIHGFCAICLWVLLNPFIEVFWLGKEYVLSEMVVITAVLNYLVDGMLDAPYRYRIACGLHWQSRYRAVLATIVNVALSISFVVYLNWGIPGVLLATIISRLGVTLWFDPYVIYKNVFQKKPWKYYATYFRDLALVMMTGILVRCICRGLPEESKGCFFLRLLICVTVPNAIWYLLFRKSKPFLYLLNVTKTYGRAATNRIKSGICKKQ